MPNQTAEDWLEIVKQHSEDAGDGLWLEDLVCDLGHRFPEWELQRVTHWDEWEDRERFFPDASSVDVGIDNVGIRSDGTLVAIQCKARSGNPELTVKDLGSFAMATGDSTWSELWVVTNARFSRGVKEAALRSEDKPLKLVDFVQPVRTLALQESVGIRKDTELTRMQDTVVQRVVIGLRDHARKGRKCWNTNESRGQIVMPCGTGKTRVAYRVMKELVKPGELAVILVPSIALVDQIKGDFLTLAKADGIELRTLAVCSDRTAGRTATGRRGSEDYSDLAKDPSIDTSHRYSFEVIGTATNEEQITDWLRKSKNESCDAILAVFSTYQSGHNTASALRATRWKAKLLVCDEAHRTAGIKKIPKDGERIRNFTLCHDKDAFPATHRLYQTATPRIYTGARNKTQDFLFEDDSTWDVRSMNDENTFGPELFRLSYVEAVTGDLLSDYRIVAWGISDQEYGEAEEVAKQLNEIARDSDEATSNWDSRKAMRALTLAAFLAGCVPNIEVRSAIAFCNRVKLSSELALAVESKPIQEWLKRYFERLGIEQKPNSYRVRHIDATSDSNTRRDALWDLRNADQENPFCVSNVGIFGEGTDSPGLSAVAFLNPRKSPVDVIQAVGRAMRKSPAKKLGYILVPVFIPPNSDPENFLKHSSPEHGWEELGQILQALRAHDGRIEDKLEKIMTFYVPPPPEDVAEHVIVVKEPLRQMRVFVLESRTPSVEQAIAPRSNDDTRSIEELLQSDKGNVKEIKSSNSLSPTRPPRSISAVVVNKDRKPHFADLSYTIKRSKSEQGEIPTWNPEESVEAVKDFVRRDTRRRKTQMRRVSPRKRRSIDRQLELGKRLLELEGNALSETGIHLNLLEKSGIQSGPRRDVNLLRGTAKAVADCLRTEDLEDILAIRLGMENTERSSKGAADACMVAAIIWLNAAIMHVRLTSTDSRSVRDIPRIDKAISGVTPARGLMDAWERILRKNYVPIFEVAHQLLQDVAFKDLESVSTALRILARDASEIAEHYANLGMDHAGELFNEVMGNQRSDGAFFTRPLAAAMLADLCLYASGKDDWLDETSWDDLRCFDPSCGSGTMLVAMMSAIKRRIGTAGGSIDKIRRFHRRAVEELMIGADINHVGLQLAGCQLTLGDVTVSYDHMNLNIMGYGLDDSDSSSASVKTGSIELLLDGRLIPRDSLSHVQHANSNLRLDMSTEFELANLADELVENPPFFNVMNPPYTPWKDVGSKFNTEVQTALRERIRRIWDYLAPTEPLLLGKKTTIAMLFEILAIRLTLKSRGVMGFVRAATVLTSEEARETRKAYASQAHVDFVLTSHDPTDFNMSWDTDINECLIVMSHVRANEERPTLFINLHRFPQSLDETHETIENALSGKPFNGSTVWWDYERVKEGDWSPAAFGDCSVATLARSAMSQSSRLRSDLIGSRRRDLNARGGGGRNYPWRVGRFDT